MAPLKSSKGNTTGKLLALFQSSVLGRGVAPEPFSATGGNQSAPGSALEPGNGYAYHMFTSPGSFVVTSGVDGSIDYLIVGGGGGGKSVDASYAGGGGGAGGFREFMAQAITAGTYAVTVGSGGALNTDGSPSTFNSETSYGGGYGAAGVQGGFNGGSGGGGSGGQPGGTGSTIPGTSTPTNSQGYNGGSGHSGGGQGGGGGGAGGAGGNASPPSTANSGGIGKVAFSGDTGIPASYGTPGPSAGRWFAGGGGGGTWSSSYGTQGGAGGAGGGGNGGGPYPGPGYPATDYTGSGGGGPDYVNPGGYGGHGLVLIRYAV